MEGAEVSGCGDVGAGGGAVGFGAKLGGVRLSMQYLGYASGDQEDGLRFYVNFGL